MRDGRPEHPFEDLYDPATVAAVEGWTAPEREGPAPLSSRMVTWGRSSVLGAVITGTALGLREVLVERREPQIMIEIDADGEPHDLPIALFLEPDDPAGSLCIVRSDPPPSAV